MRRQKDEVPGPQRIHLLMEETKKEKVEKIISGSDGNHVENKRWLRDGRNHRDLGAQGRPEEVVVELRPK